MSSNQGYPQRLKTSEQRFWEKVDKSDECWEWTGSKHKGYGSIWNGTKVVRAHRFSWVLHNGEIPEIKDSDFRGTCVLHKCDNRSCVNPNHLFLGSHDDNMADMSKKGRGTIGERNVNAKLCEVDVVLIRDLAEGTCSQTQIAGWFDVDQSLISCIVNRRLWEHVQ